MPETYLSSNNPKQRAASLRPSKVFYLNINREDNPFLDQIQDPKRLKELFSNRPYIPYAGTTQDPMHSYLLTLDFLNKMAPTQSTVISNMAFYCFGKVGLVKSEDTQFAIERDKIEGPIAKQYFQKLMLIGSKSGKLNYINLATYLFKQRKCSGEHHLKITYYELAGQRKVVFEPIDNLKILPVITEDGMPETFITFEDLERDLTEDSFKTIGKYPFITKNKDGSQSTIVQYKNGEGSRGRTAEPGIIIDMFREYKDNIYMTRQSANNFTAQKFIEFPEGDPSNTMDLNQQAIEAGFSSLENRMAQNFTNEGKDPSSFIVTTRPYDTDPTFIHEFEQNTSEKWFSVTNGMTEKRIIAAHGWSKRLMDDSDVANGLSSNPIFETLKVKLPLIEAQAAIEEDTINIAIDSAMAFLGQDFGGVDIKFSNPYQTILDAGLNQKEITKPQNNILE